jgi:hypothetical protein
MPRPTQDSFFQVPRTTRLTSEGSVELPILYYDVTNVIALFEGDAHAASALLEGGGLSPALQRGGRAPVGLSFYEYRHTSIGPYNEVGTALFGVPKGQAPSRLGMLELLRPPRERQVGAFVVDLPVTTAAACAAGKELWGYPKFITRIPFRLDGRKVKGAVMDPEQDVPICTLEGTLGLGAPVPSLSLVTYTRLGGELVRTHVDVRGGATARAPGGAVLRVGPSEHPMAQRLRDLGLDGARPRLVLCTNRFQSVLHAGSVEGASPSRATASAESAGVFQRRATPSTSPLRFQ